MSAAGDTACFDALLKATDMLTTFSKKQKGPKKPVLRIVCFSDGKDNKSDAETW